MNVRMRTLTPGEGVRERLRRDGGFELAAGADKGRRKAKDIEHRNSSEWHGGGIRALGLEPGRRVTVRRLRLALAGRAPGSGEELGR